MACPSPALPRALSPHALDLPVSGCNLESGPFGDQLGAASTQFAFLPDLGCVAAREVVRNLHLAPPLGEDLALTLFVRTADVAAGDEVFARLHPGPRTRTDPDRPLFHDLGVATHRTPHFSGTRILAHVGGGQSVGEPSARSPSLPPLIQLVGTAVSWRQAYGEPGARPKLDCILRLTRVGAQARGASRAA